MLRHELFTIADQTFSVVDLLGPALGLLIAAIGFFLSRFFKSHDGVETKVQVTREEVWNIRESLGQVKKELEAVWRNMDLLKEENKIQRVDLNNLRDRIDRMQERDRK